MTDRPIIFSGPMVRALLAGAKTQTRRLATSPLRRCEVGDRLWVRESLTHCWQCQKLVDIDAGQQRYKDAAHWQYKCDKLVSCCHFTHFLQPGEKLNWPAMFGEFLDNKIRTVPSIHMPRWASRLTLRVTAVHLMRLQNITGAGASAEGILSFRVRDGGPQRWTHAGNLAVGSDGKGCVALNGQWGNSPVEAFRLLWDSLHKAPHRWEDNPEIVAITFEVIPGNIDQVEHQP